MTAPTRLLRWLDEEVALIREHDPNMTPEREVEYRDSLTKTLRGAQLKLADDADVLARAVHLPEFGDRLLADLTRYSNAARDRALRSFFRS